MSFKDLNLLDTYRSGSHELLNEFYIPVLKKTQFYDRAVGFFSSSLLTLTMQGIQEIKNNGGKIRLIIGKVLTEEEYDAVQQGHESISLAKVFDRELDEIFSVDSNLEKYRLRLFTALVATRRLEIKFAYRKKGMYHEKIGIMSDKNGDKILFYGSANETENAIQSGKNYESFNVYKSWDKEVYKRYALEYEQGFEDIWNGSSRGIVTMKLPSDAYSRIHEHHLTHRDTSTNNTESESEISAEDFEVLENHYPVIPSAIKGKEFKLYDHQNNALRSWFDKKRRGLFKLATGSGKTITSLWGISKLFEKLRRPRRMLLIIAVPYVALAEQWVDELKIFNIVPINCFGARDSWTKDLSLKIDSLLSQSIEFAAIVVVNKTLISEKFQSEIRRVPENHTCFIGDEVHHHSAEFINKKLPPAVWRLGLSATPYNDRASDEFEEFEQESRKSRLETYYGDIVATYSLGDALADKVLTPYNYYLFEVYLTAVETDKYINLSHQIGRLMNIDKSRNNEALNSLLRKRNRIIANAEKKLDVLDKVLKAKKLIDKSYTLFYVGEGKAGVDDDDDDLRDEQEDEVSQLDEVAKVIRKNNWKVSSFTARESKGDRIKIMNSFTEGSIDGLVSMRVLDEGIDIPKCQRAFILASSRNSRQFIQRRGRILRKYPDKEIAHIYDFLVVPSPNNKDSNCIRLVESELRRAKEFMVLSANQESAQMDMDKIANTYDINLEDIECE